MTIINKTKSDIRDRDRDINESPLASALFKHIEEYYNYPKQGVTRTLEDVKGEMFQDTAAAT